ncbi:hypothetical protein [Spirosoma endbachense]|uniref:hypothetical protein n=1 Tax=Spirosoma endbachense TaxID=2666025 RepID=UPI0013915221|nr:hypothetical protein [Spirosoma endbachense]
MLLVCTYFPDRSATRALYEAQPVAFKRWLLGMAIPVTGDQATTHQSFSGFDTYVFFNSLAGQ